jgi:DprA-like N-terminal HHH domain
LSSIFLGRDDRVVALICDDLVLSNLILLDYSSVCLGANIGGFVSEGGEPIRLTDEQRLDWLRLIRSQNVGPRGIMAQAPQILR